MQNLKININGVTLDIVLETLNIKYENNSLSNEFNGLHSSYPLMIVENENTKKALGSNDISSVLKQKEVDVRVFIFGEQYYGKLQVLSIIKGFRKCNIKFFSRIVEITSEKIGSFMPTIYVNPNNNDPFITESEILSPGCQKRRQRDPPAPKWTLPRFPRGLRFVKRVPAPVLECTSSPSPARPRPGPAAALPLARPPDCEQSLEAGRL